MAEVKYFTRTTAITVVVANMVGTGVFTSLGFQLLNINSVFVLLLLWLVGGIAALCGALTYAELSTALPRSGGEYNFLGRIYHPAMGFVSGWISATVGFAAPTALAAMTFAAYLAAALEGSFNLNKEVAATMLVVALTLAHGISRNASGGFQQWFTFIKIVLILLFCGLITVFAESPQNINLLPVSGDLALVTGSAFAVSLIYVNYAYTGWNAATYITSEIEDPEKNIPLILIVGTSIVMLLYLMLNAVFLYGAPMPAMQGKIQIGVIVAEASFGKSGAMAMGLMLSVMLVSTVSAMILAGPRVLQVIGEDFRIFRFLSKVNNRGVPSSAIYFQSALTLVFVLSATFESILVFSGFILGVNSLFTVAGVFVLRYKKKTGNRGVSYKTWGYPLTPLIYIAITLWTLAFISFNRPTEAGAGLAIVLVGLVFYYLTRDSQTTLRSE